MLVAGAKVSKYKCLHCAPEKPPLAGDNATRLKQHLLNPNKKICGFLSSKAALVLSSKESDVLAALRLKTGDSVATVGSAIVSRIVSR